MEDRFSGCLDFLEHRGPDDRGQWFHRDSLGTVALGHTRLSIIDLSDAGHQPMHSPDGRWTLVLNGEIYNYLELRGELEKLGQQFVSDSDTEVLLAAWVHWGPDCLERLIGMFAFAVYDKKEKTITLVRDAFGIKPLFFSDNCEQFFFGSELGALLTLAGKSPEINPQRAYNYLIQNIQDTGFDTFVQGISHVPPAHLVRFDLAKPDAFEAERWWNPNIAQTSKLSFADAAYKLRELFLESVKLHLRSDVALGVALSGGIDSSAIACGMRHLEPDMPIHTFSYIGEEGSVNEEHWIDIVNADIGAVPHKVRIGSSDLGRDLPDLMQTQGEPFGGTAMYAQYRIFKKAREEGVVVLLEGQGGDELLGGYNGYAGQRMYSHLEKYEWRRMAQFSSCWKRWPGRENGSAWRALIGQLIPDNVYNLGNKMLGRNPVPKWMNRDFLDKHGVDTRPVRPEQSRKCKGRRLMETLLRSLSVDGLSHLLRYGDRNAMRFSIENRVPFLTLQLAEFVLSLPETYLVDENGETKSVFRASMRGIVPDVILDRSDKVGFDTPMREWMQKNFLTQGNIFDQAKHLKIFEVGELKKCVRDGMDPGKTFNWQIWRIYNMISWMERFSDDERV